MPINYRDYPADWAERRVRILKRAQHRCEHCGLLNYSIITRQNNGYFILHHVAPSFAAAREWKRKQQVGKIVVLTVAHLDHDEWNHDVEDDRLAALCQKCHLAYDRADNARRKRYGKHYKKRQLRITER